MVQMAEKDVHSLCVKDLLLHFMSEQLLDPRETRISLLSEMAFGALEQSCVMILVDSTPG